MCETGSIHLTQSNVTHWNQFPISKSLNYNTLLLHITNILFFHLFILFIELVNYMDLFFFCSTAHFFLETAWALSICEYVNKEYCWWAKGSSLILRYSRDNSRKVILLEYVIQYQLWGGGRSGTLWHFYPTLCFKLQVLLIFKCKWNPMQSSLKPFRSTPLRLKKKTWICLNSATKEQWLPSWQEMTHEVS